MSSAAVLADDPAAPAREAKAVPVPTLTYLVLLVGGMFGGLLQTALTPVLAVAAEHFGGGGRGAITAQMIVTLSGIGVMVGGPFIGLLTQWTGVRNMLLMSLGLYALCGASGLFLDNAVLLFASRFLQGVGAAGIAIATSTLIAERFLGEARPRFLGYQGAFLAATGFCALLASGQLAEWAGWRASFALFLIAVPLMVAVMFAGKTLEVARAQIARRPPLIGSIVAMWRTYLMMTLLYLAGFMIYLQLPFVLAAENIKSPAMQSQIIATGTVVHFFGGLFYGRLLRLTGQHWMFVLILLGMATSDLLVYFAQNTFWVVAACGMAGLAGGNLMIFIVDLLLRKVPTGGRPQALGLMFTAMYIGDFLNPVVATPLRLLIGNREAFLVVGVLLVGFAVVQIFLGPKRSAAAAELT